MTSCFLSLKERGVTHLNKRWCNMIRLLLVMAALLLANACGTVLVVGTAAVGAVGMVGYGVYNVGATTGKFISGRASMRGKLFAQLFEDGTLVAEEPYSIDRVWPAMKSALLVSKLKGVEGRFDSLSGYLVARSNSGDAIEVAFKPFEKGTRITIRVGATGDKDKSKIILDKFASELAVLLDAEPATDEK